MWVKKGETNKRRQDTSRGLGFGIADGPGLAGTEEAAIGTCAPGAIGIAGLW